MHGSETRERRAVRWNGRLNRGRRCDDMWIFPHHFVEQKIPSGLTCKWNWTSVVRGTSLACCHPVYLRSILILSSPRSSKLPPLKKNSYDFLPSMCHLPHQTHPPLYEYPNMWWKVQTMKLIIMHFFQPLVPCFLLDPNIFLGTLFSNTVGLCSYLNVKG